MLKCSFLRRKIGKKVFNEEMIAPSASMKTESIDFRKNINILGKKIFDHQKMMEKTMVEIDLFTERLSSEYQDIELIRQKATEILIGAENNNFQNLVAHCWLIGISEDPLEVQEIALN
jgi:hypothetical protein